MNIVFIIGAARSGTKILRDTLGQHPSVSIVPYDINFVWKNGVSPYEDDEIDFSTLSKIQKERIINYLKRFDKGKVLVEKTVSNSVRVELLAKMFPEAKFINLIRNGVDVAESTYRQWNEKVDMSYGFKKLKYFPIWNIKYIVKYLFENLFNHEQKIWGVHYRGLKNDIQKMSKLEVCAKQWAYPVEKSIKDLEKYATGRYITLSYEEFILSPDTAIEGILKFINIEPIKLNTSAIVKSNVNKGKESISEHEFTQIKNIQAELLKQLNYTI